MYGPEVEAREQQNEVDPMQHQDLTSLSNVDFQHLDWDGTQRNYLSSMNHVTAQGNELLLNKTALPTLQYDTRERTKLAPRVLNRITFSKDSFVPAPQDEIVMEQVKVCNPPTGVSGRCNNIPPADLFELSEFDAIEPHFFDLSLSPILDEGENAIIPQAESDSNAIITTEVIGCPEITNEVNNTISSSNYNVQVALETDIVKETTPPPHSLQNLHSVFHGESEIITHDKETGNTSELVINSAIDKVTTVLLPNTTLHTDTHKSLIDEHNHKFLNAAGENSKSRIENTELPLRKHYDVLNTATDTNFHLEALNARQEEKTPTTEHVDPCTSTHPVIIESVNKLNTLTDVIHEHKDDVSVSKLDTATDDINERDARGEISTKLNSKAQEAWNMSVDIFDTTTDDTLQNEIKECIGKDKLSAKGKDMTPKWKESEAMNESVDIFNSSGDTIPQSKFTGGIKEKIIHHKISDKFVKISHKTSAKLDRFKDSEEHAQTPKKPTFRAPYKVVSESPIIGYPPNRRNVTSTPKEAQQKKILRFASGYSSDSSDNNDGMKNSTYCKPKSLTTKADSRTGETSLDLIKRKLEFKPKFISKLSSFKFSVDHKKKNQAGDQSCHKKNSVETTRQIKPKFNMKESLNLSVASTVKSNICEATNFVKPWNHTKARAEFKNRFTDKTDGKSDVIQEITMPITHSKAPASTSNSGGTCYKTANKYNKKLDKFRFDIDQPFDPMLSVMETSETANSHVTKQSVTAKSSAKRKKENQVHTTARKKKKGQMADSHTPGQDDNSKKARKKKPSSCKKNKSESFPIEKNKSTKRHQDSSDSNSEKNRSSKTQAVVDECSQSTVNLSQVS